jgi:acetoacetyl-CoA synthetase
VRHIGADLADDVEAWSDLTAQRTGNGPEFEEVAWDHPLWVLFTSGTTGLPKPIVHGHGGILIEHLKTHAFHLDLDNDDTFFWYTSTNWMMWNFLVSGLLRGSAIVLYDGSPTHPSPSRLWQLAAAHNVTYFGTSAPFIELCMKAHIHPAQEFDLRSMESVGSTASPLTADGFRWLYDELGESVLVGSTSGGTDVCTPFVGSSPLLPVYAGEIQCRLLGAAVDVFDESGGSVEDTVGELVVTKPMPSMPLFFWNDPSKQQYREAYFDTYPGVWRHGDWATITSRGSVIIHGRSDSTIKRGGIRTGTTEFYRVLDRLESIADSLVIDTTAFAAAGRSEIVLFAVLADGHALDEDTEAEIRDSLRRGLSPRHVPDRIFDVPAIPRTLNGKKLEVPVKRVLEGKPLQAAAATGSIDDPRSLAYLTALLPDSQS